MVEHAPLLQVKHLSKDYPGSNGQSIRALNDVSLSIAEGEVLGVVGESGCGKSTLGRSILRLVEPTSGSVEYRGQNLMTLRPTAMKSIRKDLQIIFQDPFGSLNPRHRVGRILAEPLIVHRVGKQSDRQKHVAELLQLVGLPTESVDRFPHEFSGGQRQRIAIARALALKPSFVVADEAVSALDVSIQSQIINLLGRLQRQMGITLMFISHDLSVIRHISDRIAVMYLGRIVETGPTEEILVSPQHPYTQALVSAIPDPGKTREQRIVLQGELPDPANPPDGCAFSARCPSIDATVRHQCTHQQPELTHRQTGSTEFPVRTLACHLHSSA